MFKPIDLINALNFERLAGTDGEAKGIEVISSFIEQTGFKPEVESFEIASHTAGSAIISCENQKISGSPFGLVADATIESELIFVENANQLPVDQGKYQDKIVISYTQCRDLNNVLKDGGIKAFIRISSPNKATLQLHHHQSAFEEGAVPVVTVTYEDGLKLKECAGKKVKLEVKQDTFKANAHNIVVDVKGSEPDNNLTYLVGHFDTVANTPGSSDNAAGCACMMQILHHFATNPPKRDLKLIFCGGEEMGLLGSSAYVRDHEAEVTKRGRLVINIDVSGDSLGTDVFNILGTKELMGYADGIARENGLFFNKSLAIYSSDCMPFAHHEIPSVNIARWGGDTTCHCHTCNDVPDKISNEALERSAKAGLVILDRVLNAQIYPITKEIDDSLREKVEKYLYWNRRQEPKLNWEPKYKR